MVTMTSAENALKTVYLGVVANQLNVNANPLLGKIKQTTNDVWGKEIKKLAPYGINGGIGAGSEDGALPTAYGNKYVCFTSDLKNLYGKIDISDKAIRASQNNAGAFVNLLNDEMEGLIKASSFNLGRMLFGDGTGFLCTVSTGSANAASDFIVDSTKNLIEGLVVDVYSGTSKVATARIAYVDRVLNKVYIESATANIATGTNLYVQGSKDKEITGIGAIFSTSNPTLYGLTRDNYRWLAPYIVSNPTELNDNVIQSTIDFLSEIKGSEVNYITCSSKVRRLYQEYLSSFRRNIDIMELAGGYKAITYNGIPMVADRFVEDDTMYLFNTDDFVMHQLCDWKWLEDEEGRVLKQNQGYPTYSATLVKYADLICDKPCGQAKITGIPTTVSSAFAPIVNVTTPDVSVAAPIVNVTCDCGSGGTTGDGDDPLA